ncbi:hypothetical protein [Blastococcus colisei]|uniref:hypothetical protein n=1 Tax=Blastococcus colisei TaxID=1564162 RepID=UPI001150A36C|nr:hypothetical protein [Blastococcus colisei]
MLLIVLATWVGLGVLAAIFVAAVGKSGLREDQALGHLATGCCDVGQGAGSAPAARAGHAPENPTSASLVPGDHW